MADKKATTSKKTTSEKAAPKAAEESAPKKSKVGLIIGLIIAAAAIIAGIVVAIVLINKPNVVGKYELSSYIDSDGQESTSMVDLLKAFGANYTVEFKSDKTGVLEMNASSFLSDDSEGNNGESNFNFTYDDKKLEFTKDGEKVEASYEFKDGAVKVTFDGETMKFTRSSNQN